MADITTLAALESADEGDLSEEAVRAILKRINLNIYNILENKWDAVEYAEFGDAGHRKDPTKLLKVLMEMKEKYEALLQHVPSYNVTQWDDEGL